MKQVTGAAELKQIVAEARSQGLRIAFVPTMGALHAGHLSLIDQVRSEGNFVIASIFVNPLQFNDKKDYESYPQSLGVDARLLSDRGTDVLFLPEPETVYPESPNLISPADIESSIGETLEGEFRPGHFQGVLTVVSRLFDLVTPDIAVFGKKDAQQLALIRQMVSHQLASGRRMPLKIIAGETVRDEHGLALSSRNSRLNSEQLEIARTINKALASCEGKKASVAKQQAIEMLHPEIKLDYLEIVDANSFEPVNDDYSGSTLALFAGYVGDVRLIDNREISIEGS
ncbi:MAG TPA: pantoate--beta-alanine ligase [Microbacteriaceae bacterium]